MTETTQIAIIGAGPGGYTAAFLAADLGLAVVLVDEAPRPGGVCLYRGCMPSKALLHAAQVVTDARAAARWGVSFGEPDIDAVRLRAWKDEVVAKLTGGLALLSKQRGVTCVQGRAAFEDAHTIRVTPTGDGGGEARTIAFEHAIVATGSRPTRPAALALDDPRVLDSTRALDLDGIPESLLVIGGGYIGLELGTVYAALGSAVTIVEMTGGLLPGADPDLVRVLARRIAATVHDVRVSTSVSGLTPRAAGIDVSLAGADGSVRTECFDRVLVAVGRTPNSDVPGLAERTRVERDARGFIRVDAQRRSAESSIFAIGDVAGEPLLAHKAFAEARVAVDTITGNDASFAPRAVPAVVFTDPEVAWCGLTEAGAAASGRRVTVARFPWGASGRALTLDRPEGVTKLVLEPESGRVLGVGLVGAGAGELIAEGVIAVEKELTAADLAGAIHPHPTVSETFAEAAEVFFGRSTHVYRPKRR